MARGRQAASDATDELRRPSKVAETKDYKLQHRAYVDADALEADAVLVEGADHGR